ncbi:MAG: hypothetical protein LC731_04520 [Acidobacteria bacterium]|nr:hypothetical protein [Acidobacteriota bacterium]
MRDDELQMKAQRSLQEFDDAVERLEPNYAELGQKSLEALEEFIDFWKNHPESPQSRSVEPEDTSSGGLEDGNEMRKFVERQLEWGESQRDRVRAAISKES